MATNAQESPVESGKALTNKDGSITKLIEFATQNASTPEAMLDLFLEQDIPFSSGEELTGGYVLIDKDHKADWCAKHENQHLFVVQWNFYDNKNQTDSDDPDSATGEFAAMFIVSNLGKFIVNDSAKGGMYGQLRRVTDFREAKDPDSGTKRTSTVGYNAPRGLRANKPFMYDTRTKRAIRTDDLDNVTKHPMNFRKESRKTWSFAS